MKKCDDGYVVLIWRNEEERMLVMEEEGELGRKYGFMKVYFPVVGHCYYRTSVLILQVLERQISGCYGNHKVVISILG